jgi:hypothetical protein
MEEHLIYMDESVFPTKPNHLDVDCCGLASVNGVV